jgi:hypothetical protein
MFAEIFVIFKMSVKCVVPGGWKLQENPHGNQVSRFSFFPR